MSSVVHLIDMDTRFLCGKYVKYNNRHTTKLSEATCKTCIEVYKYSNGMINEYKCGGDFCGNKKRRKYNVNNHTYKDALKNLEKQLEKAEGVIKNMMDHQASSISGNIAVAKLSTVYRIGENYLKEKAGGK